MRPVSRTIPQLLLTECRPMNAQPFDSIRTAGKPARELSKPGTTAILACMNRRERFEQTFPKLLEQAGIEEIIVIDWGAGDGIAELLQRMYDPRVSVVSVHGVSEWNLSAAYNLAARFATHETLLKVDVDYLFSDRFLDSHPLADGEFWCGDTKRARNTNEEALSGCIIVPRSVFADIQGFNERLSGWGWEDFDLFRRLELSGLTRRPIDFDQVQHIPHDNALRAGNSPGIVPHLNAEKNRLLAERSAWTKADRVTEFAFKQESENQFSATFVRGPERASSELEERCMIEATHYLTRACIADVSALAGGTLWGKTPEQFEQMIRRHAPGGWARMPWLAKRELRELYHSLRSLTARASTARAAAPESASTETPHT